MIQFILNNKKIEINRLKADTTLLDYLRLDAGLKGTKEGCASGDCGACTVVVAALNDDQSDLSYISVNACICLLGSLHGKQVITVEGLMPKEQDLHPIQQSMVEHHASQCGFCTPGFVMSVFALSKQAYLAENQPIGHDLIVENIDGNLCRCTGYRPIIDAAKDVLADPIDDAFNQNKRETIALLKFIMSSSEEQSDENFLIPATVADLANKIFENPDARLLAGGTDLGLDITQGLQVLDKIIYLGKVKELNQIKETDSTLTIGAAVSYERAEKKLSAYYPDFTLHLHRLGSKQIRNVGTIGGNIANASPIGDMPPTLVAIDASLVLQKGEQQRTVKINDFYTAYKQTVLEAGEFLREIIIPKNKPDHQLKIYKVSKRHADDISAICAAFYMGVKNQKIISCRIAMGGMAATVKRADSCEETLLNQALTMDTLEQAKKAILKDYQPLDDVRASREYRLLMAQNLLQRLFIDLGMETTK